ncbi:hypothetical protein Emag_002380 [Eimeria magna]
MAAQVSDTSSGNPSFFANEVEADGLTSVDQKADPLQRRRRRAPLWAIALSIAVTPAFAFLLYKLLAHESTGVYEARLGRNDPLSKWISSGASRKQIRRAKLMRYREVQKMALDEAERLRDILELNGYEEYESLGSRPMTVDDDDVFL